MDESIERLAHEVGSSFKSRATRFSWAAKYAKWLLVFCSAGATALHFYTGEALSIPALGGIALSVIILLSGLLLLIFDEDASNELELARQAIESARNFENGSNDLVNNFEEYRIIQTRANELYLAMRSMKEVIEQSMDVNSNDIPILIKSILDATSRSLRIACGFTLDQHYTICVYEARRRDQDGHKVQLHCVAHVRSIDCELSRARIWESGNSVVGFAHSSDREVVIPDMAAKELGTGFVASQPKPDDDKLYRSLAAVPIRVTGGSTPWGVAIATSDRPGHFTIEQDGGVQPVEAVRALAGMMALAVKSKMRLSALLLAKNDTGEPKK